MSQLDAGGLLERLGREVRRAAGPTGAERHGIRVRPRVGDQRGQVLEAGIRLDAKHHRRERKRCDRHQRGLMIPIQLAEHVGQRRVRIVVGEQRIAVGRRIDDRAGADGARSAGLVLDDEALAELDRQLLRHLARHDVDRSTGRVGHDDADGLVGIGCKRGAGAGQGRGQQHGAADSGCGGSQAVSGFHSCLHNAVGRGDLVSRLARRDSGASGKKSSGGDRGLQHVQYVAHGTDAHLHVGGIADPADVRRQNQLRHVAERMR